MQIMDRNQSRKSSGHRPWAVAAFAAALAIAAPGAALAACGGGAISGTHSASSGSAGIHSGSSTGGSSSGVSSCGVNAGGASAGGGLTTSLAGVHEATHIAGNGSRGTGAHARTASNGARTHALHAGHTRP